MGAWWDEEKTLWLLTPKEFEALPDGTELICIDGEVSIKGKDKIDLDTRLGHIAWGISHGATPESLKANWP